MLHLLFILGVVKTIQVNDQNYNETFTYGNKQNKTIRIQTPEYEQNLNKSRDIFYSCIITSYSYLTSDNNELQSQLDKVIEPYEIIDAPEFKMQTLQLVWKRIQLDAAKYCANQQNIQTAKKMYSELQGESFNITQYFYLMNGFDIIKYQNQSALLDFDEDEEILWDIMENFQAKSRENALQNDYLQNLEGEDKIFYGNPYETQIFGQSINQSPYFSIIIFASVGLVFTGIMIFEAYNALKDSHKVETKKEKKNKKQK